MSHDQDDDYDSGISPNLNVQNLRRIKQRKGHCFIQTLSDDEDDKDDKDDDFITPYSFQIIRSQMYSPNSNALVEACVPICAILSKNSESTHIMEFGT